MVMIMGSRRNVVMVVAMVVVVVTQLTDVTVADSAATWCYDNSSCAPAVWPTLFPTCGGINYTSQSPINIVPADATTVDISPLSFSGWNVGATQNWTITNNGHSVSVDVPVASNLTVSGGGLNGVYVTSSFHFHWGSTPDIGSEHTINGTRFPAELHIVNYNRIYGSLDAAKNYSDGLAVLGIFFQNGTTNLAALSPIVAVLPTISHANTNTSISSFNVESFVPGVINSAASSFYRYNGSLTTPGCNQAVVWSVFSSPLSVGEPQLAAFRNHTLLFESGASMVDNYRPLQDLANRKVLYFAAPTAASTAAPTAASTTAPGGGSPRIVPSSNPLVVLALTMVLTWVAGQV